MPSTRNFFPLSPSEKKGREVEVCSDAEGFTIDEFISSIRKI
jgi:hypothetical protein